MELSLHRGKGIQRVAYEPYEHRFHSGHDVQREEDSEEESSVYKTQ